MSDINQPSNPEAQDWLTRHQTSTRLDMTLLANACHLACHLLNLNDHKLRRFEWSEGDDDIHDPVVDVVLGGRL